MTRNRLALLLALTATACTAAGEFLKGAERVKGDRRLPYYPPQYPVQPPAKSQKSKKGSGSKGGYDPCYGKGKGKGSGRWFILLRDGGHTCQTQYRYSEARIAHLAALCHS